jgi:hypothetical protein
LWLFGNTADLFFVIYLPSRIEPRPLERLDQQCVSFYDSSARYSGLSGPVGSGKTFALVYKALQMAAAKPGRTGLLGAPAILIRPWQEHTGKCATQEGDGRAFEEVVVRRLPELHLPCLRGGSRL